MNRALLSKFVRFLIVGLASSAAYAGTTAACIELADLSPVAAAVAAFVIGTAVSYAGNSALTFSAGFTPSRLTKFTIVTLLGFVLNIAIAKAAQTLGLHYLIGVLVILATVPVANFIGHHLWTFRGAAAGD